MNDTDEPIAPVKRRGRIKVDAVIYGDLGQPATNEAWHEALLLPERYEVERWGRTRNYQQYEAFEIWVRSEDIPEVDTRSHVNVNPIMRSESSADYTARTVSITRIDFSYWDGEHWQTITGKEESNPPSRVIAVPQPTGYIELDGNESSDDLEQARREFEIMLRDFARSTLPFPEYVAEYARMYPSIWRWHPIEQQKHDGTLDDYIVSYADTVYSVFGPVQGISIKCQSGPEYAGLTYEQALSLLAWLRQEEPTLQELAKETVL